MVGKREHNSFEMRILQRLSGTGLKDGQVRRTCLEEIVDYYDCRLFSRFVIVMIVEKQVQQVLCDCVIDFESSQALNDCDDCVQK